MQPDLVAVTRTAGCACSAVRVKNAFPREHNRVVAQVEECRFWEPEVAGASPANPTICLQ